ncbi:MAG: peroxiredoxin [Lachnospiraceae bacterium]|nr:peroxiredoxin [Lachnospiraceae bacterium]MBQ5598853.1 peroxiredoxin [Lachnospiraceae bacterium]MBQ5699218.1 peroxiredoxin [Lachnospiraceae bacterium]MBQ5870473.1 peroxiredoxin [Lachnospiraceae bacterium]MBR0305206.1 peroxiredoxin [Lachnospiraceae bacterium]
MTEDYNRLPLIGDKAPAFQALTTNGTIHFPEDYEGKWVLFFSHPSDFTPVCTTEFMTMASMKEEFRDMNVELLGLSVDSLYSHIAWIRRIEELEWNGLKNVKIDFPVIADLNTKVSTKYGMLQPNVSSTQAVRAVFIIDPQGIIRSIVYYPLTTGRNFQEIKRMIQALQKSDETHNSTPANWQPGDDLIISTPVTVSAAEAGMASTDENEYALDWFLRFRKDRT